MLLSRWPFCEKHLGLLHHDDVLLYSLFLPLLAVL